MVPVVRKAGWGRCSGSEVLRRSGRERLKHGGRGLAGSPSGVRCVSQRVLSGCSKEAADTLKEGGPFTEDVTPARQCGEQVGTYGCGGDGNPRGPGFWVCGCRVEGTWFMMGHGRKKRVRLGWRPRGPWLHTCVFCPGSSWAGEKIRSRWAVKPPGGLWHPWEQGASHPQEAIERDAAQKSLGPQ